MSLRICAGSLSERLNKEPLMRHLVQFLDGKQRRPIMVKPHVLLMSSLILSTAMALGCASGLYRQEAVDLRATLNTMKGKCNHLSTRRARTRIGRDAVETVPNKRRCSDSLLLLETSRMPRRPAARDPLGLEPHNSYSGVAESS